MKSSTLRASWCLLGLSFALAGPTFSQPAPNKLDALAEQIRKGDVAGVKATLAADPKLLTGPLRGQNPLYAAIQSGKTEIVSLLLDSGIDPNQDTYGNMPLNMAISMYGENWKPMAEALLAKGAKIDGVDQEGQTPLLRALNYGGDQQKDKIAWLLSKGADINLRNRSGRNALDTALNGSSLDVVKLILDKADVKKTDDNGNTPLFTAVARGNADYVRVLLDKGANVNAQNAAGDTVLHLAAQNPGPMLKTLLDAGARTDLKNNRGDLPIHIALRRRDNNAPQSYGPYGYQDARYANFQYAGRVIDDNATPRGTIIAPLTDKSDINARDQFGMSALMLAILSRDQESRDLIDERAPKMDATTQLFDAAAQGNVATIKTLLTAKPFLVYFRLADGTTPLHVSALWGTLGVAQYLVQKGADVNARDSRGETPLLESLTRPTGLYARRSKNMEAFLLGKKADPNALDQNDASPLHRAVLSGDPDLITPLLDKKVNVNDRDRNGQTPIFALMTKNSDLKIVSALLDRGAAVNLRPTGGSSLLTRAVQTQRKELVQLLLDKGADVNLKDSDNRSPLATLIYQGGQGDGIGDIATLLLAKGADPNDRIYSETLVSRAISSNSKEFLRALLATKKVNLKAGQDRQSPLMQAVTYNRPDMVSMLLDAGADPNETDDKGRTMAQIATERSKEMGELFKPKPAPAG